MATCIVNNDENEMKYYEIKCELLCNLQNFFGSSSQKGLNVTISGFFTSDEVCAAKTLLFSVYDDLLECGRIPETIGKHRLIQRKTDDPTKRRELDTADIIALFSDLDKAKVLLPEFTAGNLKRIPPFAPDATDICSLTMNVTVLQTQMKEMQRKMDAFFATSLAKPSAGPAADGEVHQSVQLTSADGTVGSDDLVLDEVSWANTVTKDADKWKTVEPRKPAHTRPKIKLLGSRGPSVQGDKIKAVPRKKVLTAYVGRLHIDTTEKDLSDYLTSEGVKGVVCKRLQAKNGQVFRTAAFFVTCCEESRETFYNESSWPEGAELRDWVYYQK